MVEGTTVPFIVKLSTEMILKDTVIQIVEEYLAKTEYYLVDVKVSTDNRISVEIDAFEGVSIDFCVEVRRYIEGKRDSETEAFDLAVSSAGLP